MSKHGTAALRAVVISVLVAGCVTSESAPEPPPPDLVSNFETGPAPYPGRAARFAAVGADPARDALIHLYREYTYASRVWTSAIKVDGVLVAAFIDGAATLPVSPGAYDIAIDYGVECGSFFARSDCATNPYFEAGHRATLAARPGEEIFVRIMAINPSPGFIFVEDRAGGFVAGGHEPVETRVARIDPPVPTEAERRDAFVQATLRPAAEERDTLVLRIGELFNAGDRAAALPLFERLNALPVPLDPTVDFYWGWALLDGGAVAAGTAKLARYAERPDAASLFRQEALRLIAQAEQS
jgi:hypothetical protein